MGVTLCVWCVYRWFLLASIKLESAKSVIFFSRLLKGAACQCLGVEMGMLYWLFGSDPHVYRPVIQCVGESRSQSMLRSSPLWVLQPSTWDSAPTPIPCWEVSNAPACSCKHSLRQQFPNLILSTTSWFFCNYLSFTCFSKTLGFFKNKISHQGIWGRRLTCFKTT